MREWFDVVVIGGGPAGCAAAITAARRGKRVALLEVGRYPRHKVCGEFVSAESLALLRELLRDGNGTGLLNRAPRINRAEIFVGTRRIEVSLHPAAASITRFDLDAALWNAAIASGIDARDGCGRYAIAPRANGFVLAAGGPALECRQVIYAAGRRSDFSGRDRPLVGIKAHFRPDEPVDSVQLYFGRNGYCGIQPIAGGLVNVCALLDPREIKAASADRMKAAFAVHDVLRRRAWEQVTESVTTGNCVFCRPEPVRNGIKCVGDAAGFIDPFLGDGISLALQSGALAGALDDAREYEIEYERRFLPAFRRAAKLRRLMGAPTSVQRAAALVVSLPWIGNAIVAATRAGTSAR